MLGIKDEQDVLDRITTQKKLVSRQYFAEFGDSVVWSRKRVRLGTG